MPKRIKRGITYFFNLSKHPIEKKLYSFEKSVSKGGNIVARKIRKCTFVIFLTWYRSSPSSTDMQFHVWLWEVFLICRILEWNSLLNTNTLFYVLFFERCIYMRGFYWARYGIIVFLKLIFSELCSDENV